MKKNLLHLAPFSLLVFCLSFATAGHAQKNMLWKGGTPGHENDWNCAKNWSTNRVPDEFSNVVIPDVSSTTQAPPVLRKGRVTINTLLLESNALLTIEKEAQLFVIDSATGLSHDNLRVEGAILLPGKQSSASIDRIFRH